jgi:hypothetical protein
MTLKYQVSGGSPLRGSVEKSPKTLALRREEPPTPIGENPGERGTPLGRLSGGGKYSGDTQVAEKLINRVVARAGVSGS